MRARLQSVEGFIARWRVALVFGGDAPAACSPAEMPKATLTPFTGAVSAPELRCPM